jgi:hypothetical protein
MAKKKREITNQELIDIKKIDKTKYEIIEICDKNAAPSLSVRFTNCLQVEQGINEFEKNHPNLKIDKIYFWKEKMRAYITYLGIK